MRRFPRAIDRLHQQPIPGVTPAVAKQKKKVGFTLVVRWDDLPAITRGVPSFQKQIDSVRAEVTAG
ncbi:hypothetical protein QN367_15950 [Cryobacterium sp. RTS3]|uniref:hypothetical protein n=1 Tax=Cryobacterium sp. RTS3 TaxID=3048643 RepID=UPI002B2391CC|nr:hypothetical protein [Cryobacterium sp. RTS3]MEB0000576.1 hypothetical protein [Cryobacterium sp. RTS3]